MGSGYGRFITLSLPLPPPHMLCVLQCGVPLMGCSPLWTAPRWIHPTGFSSSRIALFWVLSMGCSPAGSSAGHSVDIHSDVVIYGLQGDSLLFHGLHKLLENTLLQHREDLPPLLLHWPWCLQGCLSHFSYSSFSQLLHSVFHSFKCVITEVIVCGSAVPCSESVLGLAGTGSVWHGDNVWSFLTEVTLSHYQNLTK